MLRKEPDGSGKMRWVLRDGWSPGNHVLFLGPPASFAAKLDEGGGCAYFIFEGSVFRYSFVNAEAKLVKWLRPGCCSDERCMWLRPMLSFTPILEIQERLEAQNKAKKSKIVNQNGTL